MMQKGSSTLKALTQFLVLIIANKIKKDLKEHEEEKMTWNNTWKVN